MRRVECDGCGFAEPHDLPMKKRQIKTVTLSILEDVRFPENSLKYEADLCPNCRGMCLHEYFKIPAQGQLELPAFLGPKRRQDVASS